MSAELLENDEEIKEAPRSDAELDKLADDTTQATNRERPMKESEPLASPEAKAAAQEKELFEFIHNGKTVKGTREQLIKWAQMGYDRPQWAQKINAEKSKWEQERATLQKEYEEYRKVDAYAKSNPQWWNTILDGFRNTGSGAAPTNYQNANPQNATSVDPKIQFLEQKLSQFEPIVQQFVEAQRVQKESAEDTKLDNEIRSFREQYKDLDWDSLDENGKSLELRVLEYAQQNGIPSFRAAARDLLHDDLVQRSQALAKIELAKGIQNKTKLGVLGESTTSQKSFRNARDIRKTSYEELQREAMDEIRSGRGR